MHPQAIAPFMLAIFLTPGVALADFLVSSWGTRDVRRYSDSGQFKGVFVAANSGGLTTPNGLAYGPDGNLYVSSAEQSAVLRYDGRTGAYLGVAASTGINRASYCSFGPDGNLYVCSTNNNQVLRYNPATGELLGVFATHPSVPWPAGLAWAGNTLYVSSFSGGGVHKFDATTGAYLGLLTGASQPLYLRISGSEIHIAEFGANRIRRVLPNGVLRGTFGTGTLNGPVGLLDMPDNTFLVASWNNGMVYRYSSTTLGLIGTVAQIPFANDLVYMADVPAPGVLFALLPGTGLMRPCRNRKRFHTSPATA